MIIYSKKKNSFFFQERQKIKKQNKAKYYLYEKSYK